ncbi:MAG: transposase family protein [Moorea sp. SIO2B7]|nr:transposase family protein [Moorena sp. SIO2B7]
MRDLFAQNRQTSLIDYLQAIPDFRNKKGCRHPLWLVLLIIIMGMISSYWGYRLDVHPCVKISFICSKNYF